MPRSLSDIPLNVSIADQLGRITVFFRQRWAELQLAFGNTPTVATLTKSGQAAAIATTTVFAPLVSALYRVSYYLRKTAPDGVTSSLTLTLGWSDGGVALTAIAAALVLDSNQANQSGSILVNADIAPITMAVAYASNTPGNMIFSVVVTVEQLQ